MNLYFNQNNNLVFDTDNQVMTGNYTNICYDGHTVAWYDYSDLTRITKNPGTNEVSRWNDKLDSGHDLIQASATKYPIWSPIGILFDGSNDFLRTGTFTLNQPETVYIVFRFVTFTTNGCSVFDGYTFDYGSMRLYDYTIPNIRAMAPTYSGFVTIVAGTSFGIDRVCFNGANSNFKFKNNSAVTWNCGTNNMGGFTLGARGTGDSGWSNIQVKEIIIRNVADTTADETTIYNYLNTKYF